MKYDIEVVGERCRRKNEPRPIRASGILTDPTGTHISLDKHPAPPGDVPDQKPKGKHIRIPSTASRGSSASWRQTPYYGGSGDRGGLEDREPIWREQTGMKVRISYVDYRGQVTRSPAAKSGRSLTTLGIDKAGASDDPGHRPEAAHGLSGWGSSVSITSLSGGRPYRPKSFVSSRDKILSSVLDKYFVENHGQRQCSDSDDDPNTSFSAMPMPSLSTSRPQLTTSTPSSSPPPSLLPGKMSSSDTGQSADVFTANSTSSDSNTPRSMPSNPSSNPHTSPSPTRHTLNGIYANGKEPTSTAVTNEIRTGPTPTKTHPNGKGPTSSLNKSRSSGKGPTILNGIHAKGQGPTSSAIMNGLHKDRTGERASSNKYASPLLQRAVTNLTGKRVHFSLSVVMKEHLRNMYLQRHLHSANRGSWQGAGSSVAMAYGRLRGRRKTVMPQTTGVDKDENASPPVSRMFRKFRMVGILTVTLIRLKAAIVVNSTDRTERSAAEIQWRTLYGQQEAEKLAFSKSYYSRERITTKMPHWAMEIFDIAPEERTEADCRRLHSLFRGMRSFDKFTEEIQLNLCRVEETRIILRRGHIGHNFYFIYSGSVFVNVPDTDGDGETFIKTEAVLAHGDSFGELALLKDIRRTATVSVREMCELLVVDKDIFSQVCPKIFEKELMEKKSFISHMPLFSPKWWSADALSSLCIEAQIQEYKINKIVVENNTTEDWLYICMEGQCQVIRCMSKDEDEEGDEEEEEDGNNARQRREESLILSAEVMDLLTSARAVGRKDRQEKLEAENSKQKLLSSLGLEYADTYKRSGPFLEEVEEEERRKAFLASSGPMTLTSLMARKEEEGKTGLVYIKVGTLEAEDVFDISSLVKPPTPRAHSGLLLVSCGARLLRVKKALFLKLASPQAMEHTRALVSRHPFPSEGAIVESYRRKVTWNAYKAQVVKDLVRSRELRSAPQFRGSGKKEEPQRTSPTAHDRGHSPRSLLPPLSSPRLVKSKTKDSDLSAAEDTKNKDGVREDDSRDLVRRSNGQTDSEESLPVNAQNSAKLKSSKPRDDKHVRGFKQDRRKQTRARIFSIVEVVDPFLEPDSPRPGSSASSEDSNPKPLPVPVELQEDVGPGPEAVIVRRRSSLGFNFKPSVSVDTNFVSRRRQSRDDVSSGHVTRFNLDDDSGAATVMENA